MRLRKSGIGLMGLGMLLLAAPSRSEEIRLAWGDAQDLVKSRDLVEREVRTVLAEAGIEIVWRDGVFRAVAEAPLLDVTVVISPSDPSGAGWNLSPTAMGVYLKSEGSSAIFVFHRRVSGVLGLPSQGLTPPSEAKTLARAVARVIVHELVHRIVPSLDHAETGVFEGRLSRSALTRERLALDEHSAKVLLAAVRGQARVRVAAVRPER